MTPSPIVPRAALAAGIPARYLYWSGQSGRRYLFTCTSAAALADFDSGVAIAVSGERIVWAGDVTELARMPAGAPARRAAIYVHLLAATLAERRAVVSDLQPAEAEPRHLRLAA